MTEPYCPICFDTGYIEIVQHVPDSPEPTTTYTPCKSCPMGEAARDLNEAFEKATRP